MDGILSLTLRKKVRDKFGGRMKAMVSGGAPLNPDVGLFFQAMGLPMLQGYGQTEAGPVISCNRPKAGIRMETVGPPLLNTEVRIAEDGEIMVRGENVMHGYWHNPEETARVLQDGWLAHRRRRPPRQQGPDRHHRPQEGSDRQRQGRQCLAAAGRGHADAAAGNRPGDGLWRPPAPPGRDCSCPMPKYAEAIPTCSSALGRAVDRVNAELSVIGKGAPLHPRRRAVHGRERAIDAVDEDPPPRHPRRLWRAAGRPLQKVDPASALAIGDEVTQRAGAE